MKGGGGYIRDAKSVTYLGVVHLWGIIYGGGGVLTGFYGRASNASLLNGMLCVLSCFRCSRALGSRVLDVLHEIVWLACIKKLVCLACFKKLACLACVVK